MIRFLFSTAYLFCACVGDDAEPSGNPTRGPDSGPQDDSGQTTGDSQATGDAGTGDSPDADAGGIQVQPRAVAAGGSHSCAITMGKTVRCWGANAVGQLGAGTTGSDPSGVVETLNIASAVHLAAGKEHSCAILQGGAVQCWGLNSSGCVGDGTRSLRNAPVSVVGVNNAIALALGGDHSCALLADKTVACWGGNGSGQLGDGTKEDRLTPVNVKGLANVTTIAAG